MTAAVVVPLYREALAPTEAISLEQGCRVLAPHPFVLVCPDGLDLAQPLAVARRFGIEPRVERFARAWFESTRSYNALLMSRGFFQRFERYEHILVHQLDAFVFDDALATYCALGYDYIGAPWLHDNREGRYVGNGGFSLRRVGPALRVLTSCARVHPTLALRWWRNGSRRNRITRALQRHGRLDRLMQSSVYLPPLVSQALYVNEDGFWGQNCDKLPYFRTAPYEVAVSFSFETDPEVAYVNNGERLPFGCHAWPFCNPGFWRTHINRLGYEW